MRINIYLPLAKTLALSSLIAASFIGVRASAQDSPPPPAPLFPFLDPALSVDARATDVVSRMTLEEKVAQMMTDAKAIPRLGIPAYYWWSESLHGNANAGTATVFPQAIGLASTWDTKLHFDVATATADENRAKYNQTVRDGTPKPFQGLTFFAPNINIFRDPRWGRGQETYGEDPYLTGRFGVEFVKGLQGDDPKYLKVVATPKHYAVHSGPEPERHRFDAVVSKYDLNDTYLPAFEAAVRLGHAQSVMGAYSSLYGVPDCASPFLLQQTLRDKWGFDGYVVSDCGAISDIANSHHYAKSIEEGDALAVKAGCDLACDGAYGALVGSVRRGLITEAEIDKSVRRLFAERIRLGMFDPQASVPYSRIPMSVVDSAEHNALAERAARESLVLLKNDRDTLPFGPNIKSIAVIGPNADSVPVLVGNYNGRPSHPITVLAGLRKRAEAAGVRVDYIKGVALSDDSKSEPIPESALRSGAQPGLKAEFFRGENLEGVPVFTRQDRSIQFNFGGASPGADLTGNHFSARWTGQLVAPRDGEYTILVRGDDGFRLFLDEQKVVDDWSIHPAETRKYTLQMKSGQAIPIRLEYYQAEGDAEVSLEWQAPAAPTQSPFEDALKVAKGADIVVYVCGLTAQLEGEEGTNGGGDRTDLNLPGQQEPLLEALEKTGKPIVVVLMNGSALGVTGAKDKCPAILEAWYPGEDGGSAVAAALFGDFSPAGRLPVTFYKSTEQLPPFRDYAMKGRTYRYFDQEPLWPFGYGLGYTTFRYSNLIAPLTTAPGQPVTVTADVENTGKRESDEVAELYLRPAPDKSDAERIIDASQPMPRLVLSGFERLHLAPGEKKTVTFTLTPRQLLLITKEGDRALQPGTWQIYVGGGQPRLGRRGAGSETATGRITVR